MMTDHATKLPIFVRFLLCPCCSARTLTRGTPPHSQHGHGDADPIVEHRFGQQTVDKLRELGCKDVTFKTYSGQWPPFFPPIVYCGWALTLGGGAQGCSTRCARKSKRTSSSSSRGSSRRISFALHRLQLRPRISA